MDINVLTARENPSLFVVKIKTKCRENDIFSPIGEAK